mmetsp:Transcript_15026/g.40601  ORF Transcript_15026/g.40601 Transcript_15026/m.40601 type:complete len:237 (-) Transcript_15026:1522-2232(-)
MGEAGGGLLRGARIMRTCQRAQLLPDRIQRLSPGLALCLQGLACCQHHAPLRLVHLQITQLCGHFPVLPQQLLEGLCASLSLLHHFIDTGSVAVCDALHLSHLGLMPAGDLLCSACKQLRVGSSLTVPGLEVFPVLARTPTSLLLPALDGKLNETRRGQVHLHAHPAFGDGWQHSINRFGQGWLVLIAIGCGMLGHRSIHARLQVLQALLLCRLLLLLLLLHPLLLRPLLRGWCWC